MSTEVGRATLVPLAPILLVLNVEDALVLGRVEGVMRIEVGIDAISGVDTIGLYTDIDTPAVGYVLGTVMGVLTVLATVATNTS